MCLVTEGWPGVDKNHPEHKRSVIQTALSPLPHGVMHNNNIKPAVKLKGSVALRVEGPAGRRALTPWRSPHSLTVAMVSLTKGLWELPLKDPVSTTSTNNKQILHERANHCATGQEELCLEHKRNIFKELTRALEELRRGYGEGRVVGEEPEKGTPL